MLSTLDRTQLFASVFVVVVFVVAVVHDHDLHERRTSEQTRVGQQMADRLVFFAWRPVNRALEWLTERASATLCRENLFFCFKKFTCAELMKLNSCLS